MQGGAPGRQTQNKLTKVVTCIVSKCSVPLGQSASYSLHEWAVMFASCMQSKTLAKSGPFT